MLTGPKLVMKIGAIQSESPLQEQDKYARQSGKPPLLV